MPRDNFFSVPADAWEQIFGKKENAPVCKCGHLVSDHRYIWPVFSFGEIVGTEAACDKCDCEMFKPKKETARHITDEENKKPKILTPEEYTKLDDADKCKCGHTWTEHSYLHLKSLTVSCGKCNCDNFKSLDPTQKTTQERIKEMHKKSDLFPFITEEEAEG